MHVRKLAGLAKWMGVPAACTRLFVTHRHRGGDALVEWWRLNQHTVGICANPSFPT